MFEQVYYPDKLYPQQLDELLLKGWFRMGQSIFTTPYTLFDNRMYETIWLRHVLKNYEESKTIRNLKKRNRDFSIELKKVDITNQHELLFKKYKNSIQFNAASSLEQLLNGYSVEGTNIYNTYEINLYDDGKLIGCSYFDIGYKSAEGISAFYDPDYVQHSLGKYLIYLQIEVCKGNDFDYFYPGYFVPGFPHLDYKLKIGSACLEFLNPQTLEWQPIESYEHQGIPLHYQIYFSD
jgi:arginyl-tRNA--protein-N-Asp/Glu arginylyltransferase